MHDIWGVTEVEKNKSLAWRVRFILCLFIVSLLFYVMTFFQTPGYSFRDLRCINYLVDGTLYGGQPECVQPPMMYFLGAFFGLISPAHLQFLSNLTILAANVLCAYIILSLVKSENLQVNASLVIAYCFLIMPMTAERVDTAVASLF